MKASIIFLVGLIGLAVAQAPINWKKFPVERDIITDNPFFKYDLDQDRTTCEIIIARGFLCETHTVTTNQGYLIDLHRIPRPPLSLPNGLKPVLLQTGLIGTSADFIMATDKVSLNPSTIGHNMGIELAKQGYDVWLSNNRGSRYAQKHDSMTNDDPDFWDFSFDEISQYDIPAIIDFVIAKTGSGSVHYVGHSQGSAVMFALLSQTNAYNSKVATCTAISPITRIGAAITSFRLIIAGIKPILLTKGPVFTHNFITGKVVPLACDFAPSRFFCEMVFFSITGFDYAQLDSSRMGVYMAHQPTSTARKNLLHFDQLFNSNKFQKFDYGEVGNLAKYGQANPPEYKLTNISHPAVYVIYGQNDWFVPLGGVDKLKEDLTVAKEFYLISNPKSNHMDPLIGKSDAIEVNKKVLDIMRQNP